MWLFELYYYILYYYYKLFVKCGYSNYIIIYYIIIINLINMVVRIIFPQSANLLCRGTDISRYFRESLGI